MYWIFGVDLAYLALARPEPARLVHDLSAPHRWVAQVGPDAAVATLVSAAVWCLAAWLALGLLALLAGHLPGPLGATARGACRTILPRILIRLLAGGAGIGVIIAPVAAGASGISPLPAPTWPLSASTGSAASPTPAPQAGASGARLPLTMLPAPVMPRLQVGATHAGATHAGATHAGATQAGATHRGAAHRDSPDHGAAHDDAAGDDVARDVHVVRAGESLWGIAAARLGTAASPADIAPAWQQIYALNRPVIGSNPALLRPGERLLLPGVRQSETQQSETRG